jgi:hypothetical protein
MQPFYQTDEPVGGGQSQQHQLSIFDRILYLFTNPIRTFQALKNKPEFIIPLLLSVFMVALFTYSNRQAFTDLRIKQIQMSEKMPEEVKEKQLEAIEEMTPKQEIMFYLVMPMVVTVVFYFLLGVIFYVVGTFILGGQASFKQIQAAFGYSYLILSVIGVILAWILILVSGTAQVSTSLAILLPEDQVTTFLYQILGLIDIVYFYWIYVFGTGLSVMYNWTVKKGVVTVAALYFGYGIIKALLMASF